MKKLQTTNVRYNGRWKRKRQREKRVSREAAAATKEKKRKEKKKKAAAKAEKHPEKGRGGILLCRRTSNTELQGQNRKYTVQKTLFTV